MGGGHSSRGGVGAQRVVRVACSLRLVGSRSWGLASVGLLGSRSCAVWRVRASVLRFLCAGVVAFVALPPPCGGWRASSCWGRPPRDTRVLVCVGVAFVCGLKFSLSWGRMGGMPDSFLLGRRFGQWWVSCGWRWKLWPGWRRLAGAARGRLRYACSGSFAAPSAVVTKLACRLSVLVHALGNTASVGIGLAPARGWLCLCGAALRLGLCLALRCRCVPRGFARLCGLAWLGSCAWLGVRDGTGQRGCGPYWLTHLANWLLGAYRTTGR